MIDSKELEKNLKALALNGLVNASVIHELKGPLSIVSLAMEQILISLEQENDQMAKKFAEKASKATHDAVAIINTTKALLSGGAATIEACDITTLIQEALTASDLKIGQSKIDINLQIETKETTLNCSAIQIKQVLVNLIANAIDAIKALPEKWIKIAITKTDKELMITLTDSGKIEKHEIEKIFTPLYTTKGNSGSGIGLWLSQEILNTHKGTIKCDIIDGHTSFTLSFPQ